MGIGWDRIQDRPGLGRESEMTPSYMPETRSPEIRGCLASKPNDLRVGDGAGEASSRVRWRSWRVLRASFSLRAVTAAAYATLNGRLSVSGMPCLRRVALRTVHGRLEKYAINLGKLDLLPIVGLSPAEETMVEGTKEEGREDKRDGVQGEFCYAGEGGPVGWRLIASDRKLVPAQDVGPVVANHGQKEE